MIALLFTRFSVLVLVAFGLAGCATTGDDPGSPASTNAFVHKELDPRGV